MHRISQTRRLTVRGGGDTVLPPWAGPVLGPLVMGAIFLTISLKDRGKIAPELIGAGVGTGLVLGVLVWLCDRPSGRGTGLDVADQGTFMGRALAILSLFCCIFPIVGLGLSSIALWNNRRRNVGWPWRVSWIAFGIAVLVTLVMLILLLLAWLESGKRP